MTKKGTRILLFVVLGLVLLLGLGLMFYPMFSSWYGEKTRSRVQSEYRNAVEAADTSHLDEARAAAKSWNVNLFTGKLDVLKPAENGYYDCLDLTGSGIMGYIRIPKINVELPIYHGIGDSALGSGAGHMPQSSLPVGGKNAHTVISAHSGMAAGAMFTDLELLEIGDTWQIEVLGEVLTYEADQIQAVLPEQVSAIQVVRGQDYCTLVTCTPYGVNSHRLLVRGHRIETPEEEEAALPVEHPQSVWEINYWHSIFVGLGITGAFLLAALILRAILKKAGKRHEK